MVEAELLVVAADVDEGEIDADDADLLRPGEQPGVGVPVPPGATVCASRR